MADEYAVIIKNQMDRRLKMTEEEGSISIKDKLLTVLYAFLIGLIFNYLFYDRNLGVSYPLFAALLIAFFLYSIKWRIDYKSKAGWFVLSSIVLLSSTFAVHSNGFLHALNFLGIPFLIVAYTILVTDRAADWSRLSFIGRMFERIFLLAMPHIIKPVIFIKDALSKKGIENKNTVRRQILLGLAVSLPILIFVVPLLASADMVFEYYIKNITKLFEIGNLDDIVARVILTSVVFLYVFSYAWSFKFSDDARVEVKKDRQGNIEPAVIITMLTVVNLVYLLFTTIQFSYLYSGANSTLPQGFTYAEYARRGFFELVTVTLINFVILLVTLKIIKKDSRKAVKAVNIFLSLLVAFTCNMLFSAHYKLSLYEEAFGYTELRIYVHMFMLFMAILFIIALTSIWYKKIPLFKASFISAVIIYIVINYMNVQGIIARYNIERYYRTGNIDTYYLINLSYDAVPEVVKLANDKNEDISKEVQEGLKRKYDVLKRDYRWMEYNYSKARARDVLKEYFK